MLRHDNWMEYTINGIKNSHRTNKNDIFKIHIKKNHKVLPLTYTEALFNNAIQIQDRFNETQDVLLSGGIDSEIIVRVNKSLGIKQNIYTFRLENNLNAPDIKHSIELCNSLGLKLNLIDFNLHKFIENKAEQIYKKTFFPIAYLIRTEWFTYLDNLPIVGIGEQYWRRILGPDYTKKSDWCFNWIEGEFTYSIFSNIINRPIIGEWYLYTPELSHTYHKHHYIKKLLNDEIYGKESTWSSRYKIFQEVWPDIRYKPKLTGYEGVGSYSRPKIFDEFEKSIMGGFQHNHINVHISEFDKFINGHKFKLSPIINSSLNF